MINGEPWFRRFGKIGFIPIHRNGVLTICAMLAVAIPAMVMSDYFEDSPLISWMCVAFAVLALIAGHAFAVMRMDDDQ